MEDPWESQAMLILCVAAVGLSENALSLSSLVPKMYIYVSYILYVSLQSIKVSRVLPGAATGTEKSEKNNPISLLLLFTFGKCWIKAKFSFP